MAITRVEVLQPTYSVEVNNLAIPTGPGATIKTTGIRVVGDELVTNGKFDTDSSWAKTEFTILNGQAIATAGAASYIDQPIQFVSGKSYEITLDIISITGGSASIQARGITTVASTITPVDSGTTYRFIYTDTSDNTTLRVYAGVDTNLIVDNISVKEIALIANLDDGVIVNDLDVKGVLKGPSTFIIDPATHEDNTGTVVVAGNLQVDGTTTIINSTTVAVDDKNLTLASGSINAAAADGAGLTVDCGSDTDATFIYDGINDQWELNKNLALEDNVKATFGSSDDLVIYHDGNNSRVRDEGDGELRLEYSALRMWDTSGVTNLIAYSGGATKLYYNGSEKLATTSLGIDINGTVTSFGVNSTDNLELSADYNNNSSTTYSNIIFKTDGFERMRIDASGKVGIGTTAPAELLEISNSGSANLKLTNEAEGIDLIIGAQASAARITAGSGDTLRLGANNTPDILTIATNGGVGIGTTTPGASIDISASVPKIRFTDSDVVNAYSEVSGSGGHLALSADPQGAAGGTRIEFSLDGSEKMRLKDNGNLGVGTTAPDTLLHLASTAPTFTLEETDTDNTYNKTELQSSGNSFLINTRQANGTFVSTDYVINKNASGATAHAWSIGGSEKARVHSNGNVGIGTNSPSKRLDVRTGVFNSSIAQFTGANDGRGLVISTFQRASNDDSVDYDAQFGGHHTFSSAGIERVRITNTGLVGIGTTDLTSTLNVGGTIRAEVSATQDILRLRRTSHTSDDLAIANHGGSTWRFKVGDSNPFTIDNTGKIVFGGINLSIGQNEERVTLQSEDFIGSYNAAGDGDFRLIGSNSADQVVIGDTGGTVIIAGNLQVDGTTTTINSTTLTVEDKNITLASGAINAGAADGAGISVDCGSDTDATFIYDGINDQWELNKDVAANSFNATAAGTGYKLNGTTVLNYSGGYVVVGDTGAGVGLDYSGSRKLNTTSTGIDVTGTVTTDGVTSSDVVQIEDTSTKYLQLAHGGSTSYLTTRNDLADGGLIIRSYNGTAYKSRLRIETNGDISFYEDTGTTGGFFWDASTERLGLGTTSPNATLDVDGTLDIAPSSGDASLNILNSQNYGRSLIYFSDPDGASGRILYNHGNNYLSFETNGFTERMRIDSAGNVGIGTTSPSAELDVAGTISASSIIADEYATSSDIVLRRAQGTQASPTSIANGNILGNLEFNGYTGSVYRTGAYIRGSVSAGVVGDEIPTTLSFATTADGATSATEKMRITHNGNVGIGTTSPASKLTVSDSGAQGFEIQPNAAGFVALQSYNRSTNVFSPSSIAAEYLDIKTGTTSSSNRVRVTSSGNVGIGTTSPAYKLDVVTVSTTQARFAYDSNNYVEVNYNGFNVVGGNMLFKHSGTERMRIDSAGNLLISTTSAVVANASSNVGTAIGAGLIESARAGVVAQLNRHSTDGTILDFQKNGSAVGSIGTTNENLYVDFGGWTITESNGSLYFATGGVNKMKLDASGNLQVVGSVEANATIS